MKMLLCDSNRKNKPSSFVGRNYFCFGDDEVASGKLLVGSIVHMFLSIHTSDSIKMLYEKKSSCKKFCDKGKTTIILQPDLRSRPANLMSKP